MRMKIIARKFIMPIVFSITLHFWAPGLEIFRDSSAHSPGVSLFLLIVVRCIGLLVVLSVWEVLIKQVYVNCSSRIRRWGRRAILKGSVYGALVAIRLDHCLGRLTFLLCQGWDYFDGASYDRVWRGLSSWSVRAGLARVARMLFSVPVCLSIMSAYFALRAREFPVLQYCREIIDPIKGSISLGQLLNVVLVKVPAVLALFPIFSIVFYLYFYSHKRDVRRLLEKESIVYRKEVVLSYEELLFWFERNAYDICRNFVYLVSVRSSLVELQMRRLFPDSQSFDDVESLRADEFNDFDFKEEFDGYGFLENVDLQELCDIVERLSGDKLERFVREFSVYDEDIWDLYYHGFRKLNSVKTVERSLFTKRGVCSWIEEEKPCVGVVGQDVIVRRKKKVEWSLASGIYAGLELLFSIDRAMASLRRYLYSSRTETFILKVLSRDK